MTVTPTDRSVSSIGAGAVASTTSVSTSVIGSTAKGAQFLIRCQHDRFGRLPAQCPLDRGLLGIARGETDLGVHTGHAHEIDIDEAMAMIATGEIRDGKTIMLLQHAVLNLFPRAA